MDAENKALLALTQTKGELRQAMAEVKRLEAVREIAEEAVDRLRRIGDIYSLAYCAEIEPTEALNRMEVALRGDPPEGEIRHHVLAKELAALAALPAPEQWSAPGHEDCGPECQAKRIVGMAANLSGSERFSPATTGDHPAVAAPAPEGVPEEGVVWLHGKRYRVEVRGYLNGRAAALLHDLGEGR